MKILRTRKALQNWRMNFRGSVGFVPTMGALHEGHLSLVERSKKENRRTLVSIFVNPTQFGPREDLKKYPRPEKEDLALLKKVRADAVFIPSSVSEVYSDLQSESRVKPNPHLDQILEGRFRPGHFEGVCTVVMKLFQMSQPTRAYFGEKDYQQLRVIQEMSRDLFLPLQIVACPTHRDALGLALSSRNRYLTPEKRLAAAWLYKTLKSVKSISMAKSMLKKKGFKIQYLESWDLELKNRKQSGSRRWLIAAYFEGVRLIDNLKKN